MSILNKLFGGARGKGAEPRVSTSGSSEATRLLAECIARGDAPAARALLKAGANPNATVFPLGQDLLTHAVGLSLPDLVDLLLQFGADPNSTNPVAGSPLGLAAAHGDVKSLQSLLSKGARVNSRDADGWTPLMFACGGEQLRAEVCGLLIRSGADVNARDKGGWSGLMNAAKYGDLAVVELLVRSGADPRAVDADGWTATRVAEKMGHRIIADLLRDK